MNIFYFYDCPIKSAQAQPDKMLVKMPLETAQMLCTAHRELDGDDYADATGLYKRAYWNHPCTIWARESSVNYVWLYKHFLALGKEYAYRYGREHASITKLGDALSKIPDNININMATPVAQAMPDEYKVDSVVESYRNYYMGAKSELAQWKKREKPLWFEKKELNLQYD